MNNSSGGRREISTKEEEEWKNLIQYSVGKVCDEISTKYKVNFNIQFITSLAELTFRKIKNYAEDLEMFARHGKRSIISPKDVRLLIRKSEVLANYFDQHIAVVTTAQKEIENEDSSSDGEDSINLITPTEKRKKQRKKVLTDDSD